MEKYGRIQLFRSRLSILGQAPSYNLHWLGYLARHLAYHQLDTPDADSRTLGVFAGMAWLGKCSATAV